MSKGLDFDMAKAETIWIDHQVLCMETFELTMFSGEDEKKWL